MQSKPVQITIIVVGLLIGIVGIAMAVRGGGGVDLANTMTFVDVSTGKLYAVSVEGRSVVIPYRSPETNDRTLLPVVQNEDGTWEMKQRYMGSLENMEMIHDSVDQSTGTLNISEDTEPEKID